MRRILCLVFALCLWPMITLADGANDNFARATAAIEAATARAQADPYHPIYHVAAPAQWINDPNGPIFWKGYYHLFYQLHPFSDRSGPKYWGHVRSRDLVKWEHLPIAIWPSSELKETEIWSGCCTVSGLGVPTIFYTSMTEGKSAGDHAEQWSATSTDDDLVHWQKSPLNPVMTEALHGDRKIYDWRDPFVFHDGQKTFLVTGGNLNRAAGGQATVNIYEAQNPELTQWTYRGIMFQHPDHDARTVECPNFFKLGDKYVLIMSPYGAVQYFIGDFDAATCRFEAHTRGQLDYGPNFYAPNTMQVPDGRRLLWGWVTGTPEGHGWNGCLTLPRQLSLSPDGYLRQVPAPQLDKLRGPGVSWRNIVLAAHGQSLSLPKTNTLEILTRIDLKAANAVGLTITSSTKDAPPITLHFDGSELAVMDAKAQLHRVKKSEELTLRIYLDRSVLEVFANETLCFTKTIVPLAADPTLAINSEDGEAKAILIEAWPMKTIW